MITELRQPLHMETPKGPGRALFVIDYGPESSLEWVVFLDNDGSCWTVPNVEVRLFWNWTAGRRPYVGPADKAQSMQPQPRSPSHTLAPKLGAIIEVFQRPDESVRDAIDRVTKDSVTKVGDQIRIHLSPREI